MKVFVVLSGDIESTVFVGVCSTLERAKKLSQTVDQPSSWSEYISIIEAPVDCGIAMPWSDLPKAGYKVAYRHVYEEPGNGGNS